jgi:hypothetical protein
MDFAAGAPAPRLGRASHQVLELNGQPGRLERLRKVKLAAPLTLMNGHCPAFLTPLFARERFEG